MATIAYAIAPFNKIDTMEMEHNRNAWNFELGM